MKRQITDWGEIYWVDGEQESPSIGRLRTGIVTVWPGRHQPPHIHYEEQVIYVLEGEAESAVDGCADRITAGDLYHWKEGIVHEVTNRTDRPFRHLLVSNPSIMDREASFREEDSVPEEVAPDLIYLAAEAVRTQFLETLPYGYALFDAMGNLVLQSQHFPEYCEECCHPQEHAGTTQCMLKGKETDILQEQSFHCRYGMEVFQYPIQYAGHVLGYIQAGYIRYSGEDDGLTGKVYDAPESVVTGVKALLWRIVKAIRNYCEFEQFRRELSRKESQIISEKEQHHMLLKDLQDTQYAMTDLKINNHFLFNTLNSMASMALKGGMVPLYQSIVDLSKMFHYSLRTQSSIVPLRRELEYVKAYVQLQKLRYGEELHAEIIIDESILETAVPFNFLQPVVENAFTHGFHEASQKYLRIETGREADLGFVRVYNSGMVLSAQEYFSINQVLEGNTSHGLSMVSHKLRMVFHDKCSIRIGAADSRKGGWCYGGTLFTVSFPLQEKKEGVLQVK